VNKTLNDVTKYELILEKGLQDIKKFVNEENGEIQQKHTYTSMLVMLNDHATELQRALESCLSAKGGIIQPQVLSPNLMIEILKSSQDFFPRDLEVPVPLSDTYTQLTQ
jgi:hypothetical protein